MTAPREQPLPPLVTLFTAADDPAYTDAPHCQDTCVVDGDARGVSRCVRSLDAHAPTRESLLRNFSDAFSKPHVRTAVAMPVTTANVTTWLLASAIFC